MNQFLSLSLAFIAVVLTSGAVRAESNVNQAFQAARQAVPPELQTKVVSVYGTGTPAAIQKWYIIFYDASVTSHGRAVLIQNNQVTKTYPANGGATYSANLTFDPSRLTNEGPALSAAQGYAAEHHISYDTVHALLKQTSVNKPFRWRIELISNGTSRGYVFVNAIDAKVASFAPPGATSVSSTTHSSSEDEGKGFAHNVKKTFLGIGGDLEEFFTGDRTVDK